MLLQNSVGKASAYEMHFAKKQMQKLRTAPPNTFSWSFILLTLDILQ